MKKLFTFIYLFIIVLYYSQNLSNSENYLYSRTYLSPVTSEQTSTPQLQGVEYFDGLGRSIQNIAIKASPNGKDIVIPIVYDENGIISKSLLPLPLDTQNGSLHSNVTETSVNGFYGVPNAYVQVEYEASPIPKITKKSAPGTDWQISGNNTQKIQYLGNAISEVKRLKAITTWDASAKIHQVSLVFATDDNFTSSGYYKANTLYKFVTKDEDEIVTHSFINSNRQQVLLRKFNKNENGATELLDTYYVYDDNGNLAYVIPPKAAIFNTIADIQANLDALCYQYKYDKYNRLAEKRLPGRGFWQFIVYDKQGRPVLSQDANQNGTQWSFVKYDHFGRLAYNGMFTSSATRATLQSNLDAATYASTNENRVTNSFAANGQNIYYTNTAFPTSGITVLAVHYYDTYPTGSPAKPVSIWGADTMSETPVSLTTNNYPSSRSTKGLPTASMIKNIENDSWSQSYVWYDQKARVVGTHSVNHLGGYTKTEAQVDFSGATLSFNTRHKKEANYPEILIKDSYEYNPQMMLKKHKQQINTLPEETLAEYTYDDLGRIISKKVGNNLQNIDYTYNIRGWLTGINSNNLANLNGKLFAYQIKYNQRDGAETPNNEYQNLKVQPRYNGTVAETDWKTSTDNILRRYGYAYDGNSRLKAGFYQNPVNPYLKEYNEILNYDPNGNITNLKRTGYAINGTATLIDNLTYQYSGNKLNTVSDSSTDYTGYPMGGTPMSYDANGNMISQADKGILSIAYNYHNLPSSVVFSTSYIVQDYFAQTEEIRHNNTSYLYRSDGTKLRSEYSYGVKSKLGSYTTTKRMTDYLDGFQYDNGMLQYYPNTEGFYDFKNNRYVYNYVDHLGSVRLSYYKNPTTGSAEVLEENNYYPFGLKHQGYNHINALNLAYRRQYNGKEYQTETKTLDYGWRQYQAELGRWGVMDQLSEMYASHSPYAYVTSDPVNFIDPDGKCKSDVNGNFPSDCPGYPIEEVVIVVPRPVNIVISPIVDYSHLSWGWGLGGGSGTGGGSGLGSFGGNSGGYNLGGGGSGNHTYEQEEWELAYQKYKEKLADYNLHQARLRLAEAEANCIACQELKQVEKFLFIELPFTFSGAGLGVSIFRGMATGYFRGALIRGTTDLATQALFKNGDIDTRQLAINTVVGIGGNNYQQIGKVAAVNLGLNTVNNFGTSLANGRVDGLINDTPLNAAKIVTGTLGGAIGVPGNSILTGTVLPSIYGNGLDAYFNNTFTTHKK